MNEFIKMINDNGGTVICAGVFVAGSIWLIKYLLKQVSGLGVRIGALELEYRNDLKKLIEKTTESIEQSNELHREVIVELRSCRDRRVVAEDRR